MVQTKPRILCVDDEAEILKLLDAVLTRNGYEVIQALNGEEALERMKEQDADLVLSDVRMPRMDGLDLCRRIKGDTALMNIPVVLITGFAGKDERIKGIEAGAEDFLSKPIDPAEVLARIKMLLKVKALNEKRIGDLLIEMKFITEQQLEEALSLAKKRNIKVGEALNAMGALDKDHIYWVLSNQLNMNYIELSHGMLDHDLIKQFSMVVLEELSCLPLYETMWEIHFAIADPTDQQIVDKVKRLRPDKIVQLHLALPEKIKDLIHSFKQDQPPGATTRKILSFEERSIASLPVQTFPSALPPKVKSVWDDFVSLVFSMPQGHTFWFYKTPHECRLLSSRQGGPVEPIQEYPEEVYHVIKERLKHHVSPQHDGKSSRLLLQEKLTHRQETFRVQQLNGLNRDMMKMEWVPAFSHEKFLNSYPQASQTVIDLHGLLKRHFRLLIGGPDRLLVKQCCYLCVATEEGGDGFPPPLFVENKMETYFPAVAQIFKDQCEWADLVDFFEGKSFPFLFFESTSSGRTLDAKFVSEISGNVDQILFYFPSPSVEVMRESLLAEKDREPAGFKPLYLGPHHLECL